MASRKLTRTEKIGLLAAVAVVGTFGYLKFVNADPGRQLKRTRTEYQRLSAEVERLRDEARSGNDQRALARLNSEITAARERLEQTEILLAQGEAKDRLANTIVKLATESSLLIKSFSEITEQHALGEISEDNAPYDHRYFSFTLQGGFQDLRQFLAKVDDFPQLIAIRKIDIQKIEEDAYMRATLWISI
jgi:Tfp pilus assembly protein PilO